MANQTGLVFTQLQAQLAAQVIAGDLLTVCNDTVDQLPAQPTQSSRPGMLLGMIQSGKTKAFIGVLALAFDNGYDHAVIFTKGTKALARQTVARLRRDLRVATERELVSVYDIMALPDSLSPWELERKLVLVCKKEDDNLERLTDVLTQQYPELADKKLLLIDDEADLASIGYRRSQGVVTANVIPTQINDLRDNLADASYLMVTATPYALYLQPEEIQIPATQQVFQPIRPAFTELVPQHGAYIGGEFYFEQSQIPGTVASFLHVEVDPAELTVLRTPNSPDLNLADVLTSDAIEALRRSIITFLVGGTIRRWQQQQADSPPSGTASSSTPRRGTPPTPGRARSSARSSSACARRPRRTWRRSRPSSRTPTTTWPSLSASPPRPSRPSQRCSPRSRRCSMASGRRP